MTTQAPTKPQTLPAPLPEAPQEWPDSHPINQPEPRLVDRIAEAYPLERPTDGVTGPWRSAEYSYCVWGAVGRWFSWEDDGQNGGHQAQKWPLPGVVVRVSGGRLDRSLVATATALHDTGKPAAEVWTAVDKALRLAGMA